MMKANIDNKNILEDFTANFHNDIYIERKCDNIIYQVFYLCDCLCDISYRFGQNWFKFRMIEGKYDDILRCSEEFANIVKSFNTDDVRVKFNPMLGVYEFYFVES